MNNPGSQDALLRHVFHGEFLRGRFKLRAWFDGQNLNFEWSPIEPWKRKMTAKTKREFLREYRLFRSAMMKDCASISGSNILVLDIGGEGGGL